MGDIIDTIRAIVREELVRRRGAELAVVTETFPGDGGDGNHQVSARLHESGLEIVQAPVAVARPGVSLLPRVGDTVVVAFIGGDLNSPVVLGAVYDAEQRPPEAAALDAVYEPDDAGDTSIRRVYLRTPGGGEVTLTDGALTVALGGTELVVNDGGDVSVSSQTKVVVEAASDIEIKASANLKLEAAAEVAIKGATVKIEGQGQAELKAPAVALAGMTQFRAS
jgi:phage baseplate assembly protein gpV